jgi:uncharacterized protein (DUF1330 family)
MPTVKAYWLAKISISEPAEVYTYASTPLVLTGIEGAPAFVHIEFSMARRFCACFWQ